MPVDLTTLISRMFLLYCFVAAVAPLAGAQRWPLVAYGEERSGKPIAGAVTGKSGKAFPQGRAATPGERRVAGEGPDGAFYVVTDEADGELWKLAPRR